MHIHVCICMDMLRMYIVMCVYILTYIHTNIHNVLAYFCIQACNQIRGKLWSESGKEAFSVVVGAGSLPDRIMLIGNAGVLH